MPGNTNPVTTNSRDSATIPTYIVTLDGSEGPAALKRKMIKVVHSLVREIKQKALEDNDISIYEDNVLRDRIESLFFHKALILPENADEDYIKKVRFAFLQALDSQEKNVLFTDAIVVEEGFEQLAVQNDSAVQNQEKGADPVSMFNGQFTHTAQDLALNGAGMDFVFVRTYKNQAAYKGPLGHNWDHNCNLWLRISEDEQTVVRSTGALREDIFTKHPTLDYWVPPDGEDGVIMQEGDLFVFREANGTKFFYKQHSRQLSLVYLIDTIEDRFGNSLRFFYQERLDLIEVNHPKRFVKFTYDDHGKITAIRDFTNRVWRYHYDDFDDLIAVTTPGTNQHRNGLTTCYQYSSSQFSGELQHNLLTILDAKGQLYLENEYGTDAGFLSFNRVIRQRQGNGVTFFDYQDVIEEFEFDYRETERPAHQTIMTHRNGHTTRHVYNKFGNLLLKEEYVILQGLPRLLTTHYRYNQDGNLVAVLTPEGTITQYLYGREYFIRKHQIKDENEVPGHEQLTIQERQSFHRLLSVVRRGRYFTLSDLDFSRDVWGDMFPDILQAVDLDEDGNPRDVITKFTYESVYGQLLTLSDPRFTHNPDPDAVNEHPRHEETLTRYSYFGPTNDPNRFLEEIKSPRPVQADGSPGDETVMKFEEYDPHGRLLRSVKPIGTITEHIYFPENPDDPRDGHPQQTVLDPAGFDITTEFEVDDLGRVTAMHLPKSKDVTDGRFISQTTFNELDQVTEAVTTQPFSFSTRLFYDRNGNLERRETDAKDETGNDIPDAPVVRAYCYDEEFNLVEESSGGQNIADHLAAKYNYGSSSERLSIIPPKGNSIKYVYDERLLLTAIIRGFCTEEASTTRIEYDGNGRVFKTTDALGNPNQFKLDPLGRIVSEEDALGNITLNSYDKANNLIVQRFFERRENGTFLLLARRENQYDELNRNIQSGVNRFDEPVGPFQESELKNAALDSPGPGDLLVTQTFYDAQSRVVRTIDPLGRSVRFQYDALDRLDVQIDPLGNRVENQYDAHHNLIRQDQTELVLDPDNGTVIDRRVFSSASTFDELDRVITSTDSLGNTTQYFYDSRNNLVKTIDPLGNISRAVFDIFGRNTETIQEQTETGLGGGQPLPPAVNKYFYDKNSNVVEIADALHRRTHYTFDALNRRRSVIYPDDSTFLFDFDANDNLIRTQDNNGLQQHFTIDPLNRVIRTDVDQTRLNPAVQIEGETFSTYQHDGLDRIIGQENDFSQYGFKFNSLGWPIEDNISLKTPDAPFDDSLFINRSFNNAGEITGIEYPEGRQFRYHRDDLDRLIRIENTANGTSYPGNSSTSEAYDIARMEYVGLQRGKCLFGNQTEIRYAYDGAARIIEMSHQTSTNPLLSIQYLYDAVGNMRLRNDLKPSGNFRESFAYDSFYRLVNQEVRNRPPFDPLPLAPPANIRSGPIPQRQNEIDTLIGSLEIPSGIKTFDYDLTGNRRTELRENGNSITYTVNKLDQYSEIDASKLSYDKNGNLIRDENRAYIYDFRNRLVRVVDPAAGKTIARFFYDASGRRILEIVNGSATHLIYDESNLIAEYRDGKPFAQYVHDDGIDSPLQIAAEGGEHWYHADLIGSVRSLTDTPGNEAITYKYSPFGIMEESVPDRVYNPVLFASRRFDKELNIYDYRARHYNPEMGRFLQRDPGGMVDGTNLYQFTGNNPLSFVDSFGMEREERCESPNQINGRKRQDYAQFDEWNRQFDLEREEQYEIWKEGIRLQEISDNMLVATGEGSRKNKAWRDYVHRRTTYETLSNYTSSFLGAAAGQGADNWTDDPNIIRGVSGIGAAAGSIFSGRGLPPGARGVHRLKTIRGVRPGLRRGFRRRNISIEKAVEMAKELYRRSEPLQELSRIAKIDDIAVRYEKINEFIPRYYEQTGIKIEVLPAPKARALGLGPLFPGQVRDINWGTYIPGKKQILMAEGAFWTKGVKPTNEVAHEVGAAELGRAFGIKKNEIPRAGIIGLTHIVDSLLTESR